MAGKGQPLQAYVHVDTSTAESQLNDWLKKSRTITVDVKANTSAIDKSVKALTSVTKAGQAAQEAVTGKNIKVKKNAAQSDAITQAKKTATQLESVYTRMAKQKAKLEADISNPNGIYSSKQIKGFQADLKALQAQMREVNALKSKLGKNPAKLHENDLSSTMNKASTYLGDSKLMTSQVENVIQDNARATKSFKETEKAAEKARNKVIGFDKVGNRLSEYFATYGAQIQKNVGLYNQFMTLMNKVQNGGFASVQEANRAFATFRMNARAAGVEVESIGSKLERTFGSRVRSALAGQGVYMIQSALRGIVQNAIEVDTAMTELKKVTDASDAEYSQFLTNASDRAQNLGATLKDVVSATADYARLGYDIPDATKLADSAILYLNVGDDVESMDQATKSLISTMQGFGIAADDSMTIVDKQHCPL